MKTNIKGHITLDEYLKKYNSHSLLKQKCKECNKIQNEIKGDFSYCFKWYKFLCSQCVLNHPNNSKHNTINFKRYDSFCKIHSNSFYSNCKECKKNICIYCKFQHKKHERIDLSDFNYTDESKIKLENQF